MAWQPVNADRGSIGIACVFLIWRSKDILLALIFPSDGATVCGHSRSLNKHETDLRWLDDRALPVVQVVLQVPVPGSEVES